MANYIKQKFGSLGINITTRMIAQFNDIVAMWETRKDAPLVLHGQLIGVYPINFTPQDRDQLFHLVGVDGTDLVKLIKTIPTVNSSFKVSSDPFNLLVVWLVHLAETQVSNGKLRHNFQLNLLMYLHYKFFTARIHKSFPHTADEGVMIATVMDLSRKFDIVEYGSWYETIKARCEDLLSDRSLHKSLLVKGEPDDKFVYLLTDAYTRMLSKINLIAEKFYEHHGAGIAVRGSGAVITDAEGEKMVIERSSTIQKVDSRLSRDLLNVNAWVNRTAISHVGSQFPAIKNNLIKISLEQMSALAASQSKEKKFDPYITVKGERILVGMNHLVKLIITASAAIVAKEGIVLSNTLVAWKTIRDAFSSSRTLNPDVYTVKTAMGYFVNELGPASREATKISLRMALIMYVVYRFIILAK